MEKVEPLVSIGMPLYNAERFLTRAIESLLAQEFGEFELIIADNQSTDRTKQICESYAARDGRIRYVLNDANIGAIGNFNKVLDLAKGKYFMWAAYDDLWEPRFVGAMVELLEANLQAVLAFCSCDRQDVNGQFLYLHRQYGRMHGSKRLSRAHRYIWFPDGEGRAMATYGLMRTTTLRDAGGLVPYSLYEAADDMLILRLILRGDFVVRDEILFHKCDVPGSATFIRWGFFQWYSYYRDYRRIILQIDIPFIEKVALLISITIRQMVYQLGKPPYHLLLAVRRHMKKAIVQ